MAKGSACKIQPIPAANTFQGASDCLSVCDASTDVRQHKKTTGLLSRQRIEPASQRKNKGQRLRQTEEMRHGRMIPLRSVVDVIVATLRSGINFTYGEELCGSQPTNSV